MIHMENLVEPHSSRRVRNLNVKHVNILKEQFVKNAATKMIPMVGNIPDGEAKEIKKVIEQLQAAGSIKVEVIGGNHTRKALQELNFSQEHKDDPRFQTWAVQLYAGLNSSQALKVGLCDNELHELCRKATYCEMVMLMREILSSHILKGPINIYIKNDDKEKKVKWMDLLTPMYGCKVCLELF
jgi:hypothetical protein